MSRFVMKVVDALKLLKEPHPVPSVVDAARSHDLNMRSIRNHSNFPILSDKDKWLCHYSLKFNKS